MESGPEATPLAAELLYVGKGERFSLGTASIGRLLTPCRCPYFHVGIWAVLIELRTFFKIKRGNEIQSEILTLEYWKVFPRRVREGE